MNGNRIFGILFCCVAACVWGLIGDYGIGASWSVGAVVLLGSQGAGK